MTTSAVAQALSLPRPDSSGRLADYILIYMKSVLVQMDDHLYNLLNRVAPPAGRKRAQFIRTALLRALMEVQEANTRAAYLAAPDSEAEADDWATAEEYRA